VGFRSINDGFQGDGFQHLRHSCAVRPPVDPGTDAGWTESCSARAKKEDGQKDFT